VQRAGTAGCHQQGLKKNTVVHLVVVGEIHSGNKAGRERRFASAEFVAAQGLSLDGSEQTSFLFAEGH